MFSRRSFWTAFLAAVGKLVLAVTPAVAAVDCAAETAALESIGRGAEIRIDPPSNESADGKVHVSWHAKSAAPLRTPVFIAIAIPGEVRFWVPPLPPVKPPLLNLANQVHKWDLPGFIALSPVGRGPLGLEFGNGQTRALVPLQQPGVRLTGAFDISNLAAGETVVKAAVVARTSCGERVVSADFGRTLNLKPGAPQIVVQDPYDIDQPQQVILSNDGRYRAHLFEGRYHVYDIKTGAKLADRAGTDVNFSPTSRFIVANAGSAGQIADAGYEAVDLATGDVIGGLHDPFIGFAEGDSFIVVGRGGWGALLVRSSLISRPVALAPTAAIEEPDDGLSIVHWGSCHACASWTDDTLSLDLDNGVLIFAGGQPIDPQSSFCAVELASGAENCAAQPNVFANAVAKAYGVLPFLPLKGWSSRTPFRFSHVYALGTPVRGSAEALNKDAKVLASLLQKHQELDPKTQRTEVAALAASTRVRGDWRSHVDIKPDAASPQKAAVSTPSELAELGLSGSAPLDRTPVPFVNSSSSLDLRTYWDGTPAQQKQIDAMIAKRTTGIEQRLIGDVPALKSRLGRYKIAVRADPMPRPLPLDDLEHGKFYLDETLEGLWRWELKGRPVWLMQLWATEGNGGVGEGTVTLLLGDAPGSVATGGRIIDLTKPLETFWSGQHGSSLHDKQYTSEHETQLKPQIYLDRYLVIASVAARTIAVIDLETVKVIRIFSNVPQSNLLANVILSPDARHVIQVNADHQFFLHDIASGRLAVSGRVVDDEIIAYTPEGYYWSSYEGAHFVQFHFPGLPGTYSFQQFAHVLDRPDIIRAQLQSDAAPPAPPKLVPPPLLEVSVDPPAGGNEHELRLRLTARASTSLARARIFADGQLVHELAMTGTEATVITAVSHATGARWLTAQVTDTGGLVSAPQSIRLAPLAAPTRKLFAVVVGNDQYANPQLTLKYAGHDAERLGAVLTSNPGRAYASSVVKVLTNNTATASAIIAELTHAVEQAGSEDTVLFSFAGHGYDEPSGYYLTNFGFDDKRVTATALAWRDIATVLRRSKARIIVILDACHAGLSGTEGLGTNDQALHALLAGEHPPMLVLAASKGRQSSFEDRRWDGGLFTFALLEVLQGKRATYDLDRDGAIEVSELYRGLRTILARETGDRQTPWLVRQDLIGDFAVF